jgi:cytidyltransferase-like protein
VGKIKSKGCELKVVLVTGGFDPIHSGHIAYFKAAKELGDKLIVGINSDAWLERKKGRAFMPFDERSMIVGNLLIVDGWIDFDDSDNSARDAIRKVKEIFPDTEIIFANGGDRTAQNIPEMTELDVVFKFGVGGDDKKNSSSWILDEWKSPKTERNWGYYRVLHDVPGTKVKELTINPGEQISLQRHFKRNEFWFVTHGACDVVSTLSNGYVLPVTLLREHLHHFIPKGDWHQLRNPYSVPCKIVEIQYGESCDETDIERK